MQSAIVFADTTGGKEGGEAPVSISEPRELFRFLRNMTCSAPIYTGTTRNLNPSLSRPSEKTNFTFFLSFYRPFLYHCCRNKPKTFAFDHCFYSLVPGTEHFASQEIVFDALGRDILDNAFQGYNACIFAYGQTGTYRRRNDVCDGDGWLASSRRYSGETLELVSREEFASRTD